ncbi:hemicentin-1 [Trichomycterus rosablanca]|uniref:hemicentin-1 n=1 Tax=Trichomycterus rosablanca TaxID=2290929 RepID=UPI002F3545CD
MSPVSAELNPELELSGSSLTFVFDVTGSMYDDLQQVMDGASRILYSTLNRADRPVRNFVLVPFHDPDIGPVSVTTDPKQFQRDLQELFVQGGGDCPEMSVGAIHTALEVSLPGSFIYVFTDARAKDYRRKQEVLQLVQLRQPQVVFVLTGDCGDRSQPGYRVYEEIAATSSGQILHLDKQQVNEVLKWVEETVQAMKVHLLSSDHELAQERIWELPFDPGLKEVTVSLSGPAPRIELRDPRGRVVGENQGLRELLNIPNSVLVVNLKNPHPGIWTLKVACSGRHTLRVTGVSNLDFRAGFSLSPVTDLSMARERPMKGVPAHVFLKCSGLNPPGVISSVVLVSKHGEDLLSVSLPLPADGGEGGVWMVPGIHTPSEGFFIKVKGKDGDGFDFHRLSSVLYTNIIPGVPVVEMPAASWGKLMQRVLIECTVQSDLPFTLTFSKDGKMLSGQHTYQSSAKASWEIPHVSVRDSGVYECTAQSSAGTGRGSTHFTVRDPPVVAHRVLEVVAVVDESVTLPCEVKDRRPRSEIVWTHNGHQVQPGRKISIRSNGSLHLDRVAPENAGKYVCTAVTEGGFANITVTLQIHVPPVISAAAPDLYEAAEGFPVSLPCEVTGVPTPSITWTRGGESFPSQADGSLWISRAAEADSGRYVCTASSTAGVAHREISLSIHTAPRIVGAVEHGQVINMTVDKGSEFILPCEVVGSPTPTVSWSHNGRPIPPITARFLVLPSGSLKIRNVVDTDADVYICTAKNTAGIHSLIYSLTVQDDEYLWCLFLVVPLRIMGNPEEEVNAVEGHMVSLVCDVQTLPPPEMIWTRDGQLLHLSSDIHFLSGGGVLQIPQVNQEDGGQYVCTVTNSAGHAQKSFILNVQAPPSLLPLPHSESEVMTPQVGSSVTLTCEAQGVPEPDVTWYRNSVRLRSERNVHITEWTLTLNPVQVSDGGVYSCTVFNGAGRIDRSFTLTVQSVPPSFVDSDPSDVSAPVGAELTLECKAEGTPTPELTWMRNGVRLNTSERLKVSADGSTLTLLNIRSEDSGSFTCSAVNSAGHQTKIYNLIIPVLPSISGDSEVPLDVQVLQDDDVSLECDAAGVPPPEISWYKDGNPLETKFQTHLISSNSLLRISQVRLSDSGFYSCVARNKAGSAERKFHLQVQALPVVERTELTEHLVVVRGSVVTMVCEAHGDPPPSLTWTKDNEPLSLHQNLHQNHLDLLLQDEGKTHLQLLDVQLEDAGLYSCTAKNRAGTSTKTFNLTVLDPPQISGSVRNERHVVVLDGVLELECEVSGVPPPTVRWLKDGRPLQENRATLHRDGQILTISSAQVDDAGVYTCVASNAAGEDGRSHLIHVQLPPTLLGSSDVRTLSVPIKGHVTLECQADSDPPPEFQWYKDDVKLQLGGRIQSIARGQFLEIGDVRMGDGGRYSCVVSNMAGSTNLQFNIQIIAPPVIRDGSSLVTSHVNQRVVLPCEVEGDSDPVVVWRKDGHPVQFHNDRLVLLPEGSVLIRSVQLVDAGHYFCTVSNQAGTDQKIMELKVYVSPSISPGPFNVTVTMGRRAVLHCESSGVPAPQVSWRRNGKLLDTHSESYRVWSSGSLLIISSSLEDEGYFECTASNEVGEDRRVIEVFLQVPPSIDDNITSVTAVKMAPVVLPCQAMGRPAPTISWSRDGAPLGPAENSYKILPTGMLKILEVNPSHEGKYTCSAHNSAGVAHKHITLSIHEKPVIRNMDEEVKVLLNQQAVLKCDVHGFPKPTITWQKEGIPIVTDQRLVVLSDGALRFSRVTLADAGTYSCLAQNTAGTAEGKRELVLQAPPLITAPRDEYTLVVGESVSVPCSASGQPEPELQWNKAARVLKNRTNLQIFTDGTLHITNTQLNDAGVYTCTATNTAGRASRDITLILHVPPVISSGQSEVSVLQGFQALLTCSAQGSPDPKIHWERNGGIIKNQSGKFTVLRSGELIIERTQVTDAGVFTCVAVNAAGSAHHQLHLTVHTKPEFKVSPDDVTLRVGQNLSLTCHAHSTPPPTITWTVNNRPYTGFIENDSGRSLLLKENVTVSDGGIYTCKAENTVGSVRALAFVHITDPPVVEGDVHVSQLVSRGGLVVLNCPVRGNPAPVLNWFKDGRLVQVSDRLYRLQNGSLALYRATVEDTAVYSCVAENEAGSAERRIILNVQVPGGFSHWEHWGPCSVTCGRGLQKRIRLCNNPVPATAGAECDGPNVESRPCQASSCSGDPLRRARGSVIGMVNDHEFGVSFLDVNITENSETNKSFLQAHMHNVLPSVGPLLQILVSVLTPVYWTAVYESTGTKNGFSISGGNFRQESQLEFQSGEILKITHVVRGVDVDGVLLVDIVINGFVPPVLTSSSSQLHLQDFSESYVLVSSGQVYSWTTQNSLQQGDSSVMWRCNHSIVFDGSLKRFAPLLQEICLSDISSSYSSSSMILQFHITAQLTLTDGDGEKCPEGFLLDEAFYCADEDECAADSPCSHFCINTMGGFTCKCPYGFIINSVSNTCQDIDECVEQSQMCYHNQLCVNTVGSYRCQAKCGSGFKPRTAGTAGSESCEDVDECQESSVSPCQHQCFNTLGSFHCGCLPGYQLIGHRCFDINECLKSVCPVHQPCRNTDGGYQCVDACSAGMIQDEDGLCVDIDECKNGSHMCRYSQTCQNFVGGYVCLCPRGYRSQGSGKPCIDVDECVQTPSSCVYGCRNIPGSFRCLCPPGSILLGDGRSCAGLERGNALANQTRVRLRLQPQLVSARGQTQLSPLINRQQRVLWSNTHHCPLGYKGTGNNCVDVDECFLRNPCQHECRNTVGSFQCFCPSGYQLMPNGRTCRDIDECTENRVQCAPNQMCFNMRGGYQCLDTPCPSSYHKGGSPGICYKPCSQGCAAGSSSLLLQYKLINLPLGIPAHHNVVRLSAFSESGVLQKQTSFIILDQDGEIKEKLFGIKDEDGRGIIFSTRPLHQSGLVKLTVQATTQNLLGQTTYQSLFIIYISISTYPY